jgi:hypothetical protein
MPPFRTYNSTAFARVTLHFIRLNSFFDSSFDMPLIHPCKLPFLSFSCAPVFEGSMPLNYPTAHHRPFQVRAPKPPKNVTPLTHTIHYCFFQECAFTYQKMLCQPYYTNLYMP